MVVEEGEMLFIPGGRLHLRESATARDTIKKPLSPTMTSSRIRTSSLWFQRQSDLIGDAEESYSFVSFEAKVFGELLPHDVPAFLQQNPEAGQPGG
jgi:hypothetical protein